MRSWFVDPINTLLLLALLACLVGAAWGSFTGDSYTPCVRVAHDEVICEGGR